MNDMCLSGFCTIVLFFGYQLSVFGGQFFGHDNTFRKLKSTDYTDLSRIGTKYKITVNAKPRY
jgi:hypothetical protein